MVEDPCANGFINKGKTPSKAQCYCDRYGQTQKCMMYPNKGQIERVFSRQGKGQNRSMAITVYVVQTMTGIGKTSQLAKACVGFVYSV